MAVLILVLSACFSLILMIYFKKDRRKNIASHQATLQMYLEGMKTHQLQITKRAKVLNNYDFESYNLKEVLMTQNME
tara:strand:+ start:17228 stop:17458 length:231 start_codon:yes stop_codon:yes gene_type:complete